MKLLQYKHSYSPHIDVLDRKYYKGFYEAVAEGLKATFKVKSLQRLFDLGPCPVEHMLDVSHYYNGHCVETFTCELHTEENIARVIPLHFSILFEDYRIPLGGPNPKFLDISFFDLVREFP